MSEGKPAPLPQMLDAPSIIRPIADGTVDGVEIPDRVWEATRRRLDQQDRLIKALVVIFGWLNGAVILLVILFWIGDFWRTSPVITDRVVMSIIGATIVQAGLAFAAMTKSLFASTKVGRTEAE